jgi:hypothetical protein
MAVNYPSSFDNGSAPGQRTVNNVTDRRDFHYFNAPSIATATNLTAVGAATTTALPTAAYSAANGTITAGSAATLVVDGVSITSTSTRVLVKNQAGGTGASNGIYALSTIGGTAVAWVLTRTSDFNEDAEALRFSTVSVSAGTVNSGTKWYLSTEEPITVGTSAMTWSAMPTTVDFVSAANYPTDANVGVSNLSNATDFVDDFRSILNVLEYEINAIQSSFASVTTYGYQFMAASNILSIRNLKSKADKYVFELKRLRSDIDRVTTTGFPGNDIVGMGLTSTYPSGRNRGWGPN